MNKKQISSHDFFIWTDEEIYEHSFYKQHVHNFFQTVFVKKGLLKYTLRNGVIDLRQGDFLIIPPDTLHCPVGGQDPSAFGSIEMKFTPTAALQKIFDFNAAPVIIGVQPESIEYAGSVVTAILREWRRQAAGVQEALHCLVQYLFLVLGREQSAPAKDRAAQEHTAVSLARNRKRKVADQVRKFIDDHYGQAVHFGRLAREHNISLSYLSEVFKEQQRHSLTGYLNAVRINKAKELMKTSELNFTQIAETVGYQNVYYFSKVFKDLNKITPSQYRELINKNLQTMGFLTGKNGGIR